MSQSISPLNVVRNTCRHMCQAWWILAFDVQVLAVQPWKESLNLSGLLFPYIERKG